MTDTAESSSGDKSSPGDKSVSEADATSEDGTRYRTLRINKSGESSDEDS
ncbi:hypothetical protein NGM10_12950 [Halorussus salilacus]|nr:hypothetical protein [Halorussus salilacus]USZ67631.1 hypothetical protein NGM10_12950 [Halorussus salilacus]